MANRKLASAVAAFLLCLAAPALGKQVPDDGSPPKNLVKTKATISEVFRGYRRAVGQVIGDTSHTSVANYTITFGGLSGTVHTVERGDDDRSDTMLGAMHTAYGTLAGKKWSMNENGQVVVESGLHRRDDIDAAALRDALTGRTGVSLIGESASPAAYVVKVEPRGGRLEYIFFDKRSLLIDRIERMREGRRVILTLDDYRNTRGLMKAWHFRVDDGRENNVREERLVTLLFGAAVPDADLALPLPPKPIASIASSPASIDAKVVDDRIIVSAKIARHKVDFELDSGASEIVIDRDVVEALKLEQHGRITGETAGTYVESDVVIPKMQTGGAEIENAHARSLPFTTWASDGSPVAGLLGFDFIHDLVLHIDYLHGTVEALSPDTFTPPPDSRAVPIALDDNVPIVTVDIGKAANLHFILDTGADRSLLFAQFVSMHSLDVIDQGLGAAIQASFPFVNDFAGVGGIVNSRPVQVGPLVFAGWTFPRWLFYATQDAASFESEDYDGLIGQDVLRNYDVWLDYPHSRVYLRPNDRFRQRWNG